MEDLKDKIEVMGYDILGLNDVVYLAADAGAGCDSCSNGCSQNCSNSCSSCSQGCKLIFLII